MSEKTYQLSEVTFEEDLQVSKDQRKSGLGGIAIRKAILAADPNAYAAYQALMQSSQDGEANKKTEIPLNSSLGTEQAETGRVITFNVAGSGFKQPLRYEKDLASKNNIWLDSSDGERTHIKEGEEGKTYQYTWQDGTKTTMTAEAVKAFTDMQMDATFGEGGVLGKEHIRRKDSEDQKKTKYNIAGPLAGGGSFNVGDYSIDNTRENIEKLGAQHFDALLQDKAFMESGEQIYLNFSGHSRGGVGAMEGACKLKGLLKEKYPQLAGRVHFTGVLYDPVPGPKNRVTSNVNHVINLREQTAEMKAEHMEAFDENDHVTVVYSMGCNHDVIDFSPMKVLGADTVILTGHDHKEGLKDVEMQDDGRHRKAYVNAENGQAYRASGLGKMPKGVFISDENNVMVRAKNMDVVEQVIDSVYTRSDKATNRRIRRITEACSDIEVRANRAPS